MVKYLGLIFLQSGLAGRCWNDDTILTGSQDLLVMFSKVSKLFLEVTCLGFVGCLRPLCDQRVCIVASGQNVGHFAQ